MDDARVVHRGLRARFGAASLVHMPPAVTLSQVADVLTLVPYLFGFHPADSLVLIGVREGRVIFQLRGDLTEGQTGHYLRVARRQRVTAAMIIGYGPPQPVIPLLNGLAARLAEEGVHVLEAIRVTDGRYWTYGSAERHEAVPIEPASGPVAAAAVAGGHVALASRAELERRYAPLGGPAEEALRAAVERADRRLVELVEAVGEDPGGALLTAGRAAVEEALARQRAGARLDDDALAWLLVVLVYLPVRDFAAEAIDPYDPEDLETHLGLWTDAVRRAMAELAAAPATLLALAAWHYGDGVVASIAADRALAADPDYELAAVISGALSDALSPDEWIATRSAPA